MVFGLLGEMGVVGVVVVIVWGVISATWTWGGGTVPRRAGTVGVEGGVGGGEEAWHGLV